MSTEQIHPLHLNKLRLAAALGWTLRLHVWHGGGSEAPHDHRHPLWVLPLRGTWLEKRYRLTAGCRYLAHETGLRHDGTRAYLPRERTGLTPTGTHLRRPLRPFRCRLGVIHAYRPAEDGPHWSLVLLGPETKQRSTVWLEGQ